jgi:hypothetical protein
MGHIVMHGHVKAPIERAFAFACDTRRTPEWAGWITEVEAGDGFAAVGQRATGKGHVLGRQMEMTAEVVEFLRPRLLTVKGTSTLGGGWTWRTAFTPVEGGTDFDWDYQYEMPGKLASIFDHLVIERAMERDFHAARDQVQDIIEAEALQPA